MRETGEKLENDECVKASKSSTPPTEFTVCRVSVPPVPHLQSASRKAVGRRRLKAANNKSRVSIISVSEYVTRRLCIKKMPGRAGHESNRVLVSLRGATFVVSHRLTNTRVACTHD